MHRNAKDITKCSKAPKVVKKKFKDELIINEKQLIFKRQLENTESEQSVTVRPEAVGFTRPASTESRSSDSNQDIVVETM